MLKNSEKISLRRIIRTLENTGLKKGSHSITETIGREFILPPLIKTLIRVNKLSLFEIDAFPQTLYKIDGYKSGYRMTPELPYVSTVSEGFVIPEYGILLDENKKIINTLFQPKEGSTDVVIDRLSRMFINDPALSWSLLNKDSTEWLEATNLDTVAPLFPLHINYYHWLIKTLPKVRYVHEYENKIKGDIKFIVPRSVPKWMVKMLEFLRVPQEKIIRPKHPVYNVKDLVIPSWVAFSADDFNWIKGTMIQNIKMGKGYETNIFISREDAHDRHITNQAEVLEMLEGYGFKKFVLSELSTKKLIQLFNQANIIVGAHGAGLSDIIFSNNASVIELYGSRYTTSYANIAKKLGLKYTKLQCEPMYTDIRVDIEQLESAVQEAL